MTMTEQEMLLASVEADAGKLCESTTAAVGGGVPEALLLPALVSVFQKAGMFPEMDLVGLLKQLAG